MSRSGYTEDWDGEDQWAQICYRGAVKSAMRGKRGQEFFKAVVKALDEMPEKYLVTHELKTLEGDFCTLGVFAEAAGIETIDLDPEDYDAVAKRLCLAPALIREVVWENDDVGAYGETCEQRWSRMRQWAESNIKKETDQ